MINSEIKSWLVITFGCILSSLGYVTFITPMHLYEGGVIGVAFLGNYVLDLPIGITALILNYLIFIVGAKILGKGFGVKSIYATTVCNLLFDLFAYLKAEHFPGQISENMLLNSFYGGILIGTGMGLVFYHGASTGGSDAFAQIMRWLKRIPIGKTLISVDFFVLSLATIWAYHSAGSKGLESIMYSFLFIFIQIKTVDVVLNGFNASQKITIATEFPENLQEAIVQYTGKSSSLFGGKKYICGTEISTLTTVLAKKRVPELRRIISEIDHNAFVLIQDVHQVYGRDFESLAKYAGIPKPD